MIFTRIASCLLVALCMTGCATLPTFRGPPPRLTSASAPWPDRLRDFRGIIHCHGYLSHDSRGTFEEIERAAARVGVDFIVMTDHITTNSVTKGRRGMFGRTLFIVGAEFHKGGGSILGVDLTEYIDRKQPAEPLVDAIHAQGGLAFIAHAEKFQRWDMDTLEGIEVYNVHPNVTAANKAWLAMRALFVPPGTLFRSLIQTHPPNFQRWDEITQSRRLVGFCGNDAHQNVHLFGPRAGYIGTYEQMFKISTTHVIAPRLDKESVMEALRKGHCFGALELWGDATGFVFTASNGREMLLMGDEAKFHPNWVLGVQLPVMAEIRLIKDGRETYRGQFQSLSYQVRDPGVYRVEVWLRDRPWIFSNPIYLR